MWEGEEEEKREWRGGGRGERERQGKRGGRGVETSMGWEEKVDKV